MGESNSNGELSPLVSQWTGVETRMLRLAMRMSVRAFAAHLGLGVRTITKWETAGEKARLRPDNQAILDTAFRRAGFEDQVRFRTFLTGAPHVDGKRPSEKDVLDVPWTRAGTTHVLGETAGGGQVERRDFLALSSSVVLGIALDWASVPQEKLIRAVDGHRADAEVVGWVESRLSTLWRLDDALGGNHCLDLATAELRLVTSILRKGTHAEAIEQRLYRAASELCRFAGWAAFDAQRPAMAQHYWHAGLRAAATGNDPEGGAYILSNMALQAIYADDGRTAINLLSVARDRVAGHTSETVSAMLDTWQVRAHAVVGEKAESAVLLNRADERWERRASDDDPAWIYWMTRPSHTAEAGKAFLQLGDGKTAESLLASGLSSLSADSHRDRILYLTNIAAAQLHSGGLEQALATATEAATAAHAIDSSRVIEQLSAFTRQLPSDKAAEEFRDYLHGLNNAT